MTATFTTCTCSHDRSDHYNAYGSTKDIGPCKIKTCDCTRYQGGPK